MNEDTPDLGDPQKLPGEADAVVRALRLHSQPHADLFESMGWVLREPLMPAWRRVFAHLGRELTSGLPEVLLGSSVTNSRPKRFVEPDSDGRTAKEENQRHKIARMVAELTETPLDGLHRSRYVVAFMDVHDWVQSRAHERRNFRIETEGRAEYREVYLRFGRLLLGLVADYPTTRRALDPILADANTKPWQAPDKVDVARAIQLTPRLRESDYFFGRLENPLWLDLMSQSGAFDVPPPPVIRGEYTELPRWPLSEFVARVSGSHPNPETVAVLIGGIGNANNNIRVLADLLRAAASIPPHFTADLTPDVRRWIEETSPAALSILLDELGVWMVHQAADVRTRDLVLRVLRSLIEPFTTDHDVLGIQANLRVSDWDLGRFTDDYLVSIAKELPVETTERLAHSLGRALAIERGPTGEKGTRRSLLKEDFSSIWLRRITAMGDGPRGADRALARAAFSVASAAIVDAPSDVKAIIAVLEKPGWMVHSRLSLALLAALTHSDDANQAAFERLSNWRLHRELSSVPEVDALLASWFPTAVIEQQRVVLRVLSRVARDRDKRRAGSGTLRLIRQLSLVRGSLPSDWHRRLSDLESEHGVHDEAEPRTLEDGWVSRESPLTDADLSQMGPSEIAEFAQTWTPPDGFDSPNRESLATAIRTEAVKRPGEFASAAMHFIGGRAIYVRAVLDGLNESRPSNAQFEWDPVLTLCAWCVSEVPAPPQDAVAVDGDESPWRWVFDSVAQLLHFSHPDHSSPPPTEGDRVWAILSVLLSDMEGGRSGLLSETPDFVHHSLNSTLGKATDSAIWWGVWLLRDPGGRSSSNFISTRLATALAVLLADKTDASLVARASIGHYLPQLIWMSSDWVETQAGLLFTDAPDSRFSEAVWESYLRYGQPDITVSNYRALSGQYLAAVEALDPTPVETPPEDRDSRVRLGSHLLVLYLHGELELDGIITSYFERAPELVRRELLNWLGRVVRGWDLAAEPPLLRAKAFWEWREQALDDTTDRRSELLTLAWWCGSGLFEPDWIAERLAFALSQGPAVPRYYYTAEDMLDVVVRWDDDFALVGLTILRHVVEQREWAHHSPYLEQAAAILRRALRVDSSASYDDAVHVVDLISRAGHSEIEQVLEDA